MLIHANGLKTSSAGTMLTIHRISPNKPYTIGQSQNPSLTLRKLCRIQKPKETDFSEFWN